jgi:hypothetical protein
LKSLAAARCPGGEGANLLIDALVLLAVRTQARMDGLDPTTGYQMMGVVAPERWSMISATSTC